MGPLADLKVLELAGQGPVPFCGMLLADMGADVVRIDRTGASAPPQDLRGRNKRSVVIDLKSDSGREIFLDLVRRADVLMEGYRPGVMERLSIGPNACMARNASLVFARATGWGQDGPLAQSAGHDINYLALTGALHMIGEDGRPPVPPLNLVGDYGGGALYLAFGILSALHATRLTGKGQIIDAAMLDGVNSLLSVYHGFASEGTLDARRGHNLLDGGAPFYATYETSDGKYIAVGAIEAQFYQALLDGLGLNRDSIPDRSDRANWPVLKTLFKECILQKTRDAWIEIFIDTDACVSPVLSMDEVGDHPQNRARGALKAFAGGTHPAPAPRFSETSGELRLPPPRQGQHSLEVLTQWGVNEGRIDEALSKGAVTQVR